MLALDVPGAPAAVRTLPVLQVGQVHVGVTPLDEVADVVTGGGITFLLGVLVAAQTIAVADVGVEPAVGLDLGGDGEGGRDYNDFRDNARQAIPQGCKCPSTRR